MEAPAFFIDAESMKNRSGSTPASSDGGVEKVIDDPFNIRLVESFQCSREYGGRIPFLLKVPRRRRRKGRPPCIPGIEKGK